MAVRPVGEQAAPQTRQREAPLKLASEASQWMTELLVDKDKARSRLRRTAEGFENGKYQRQACSKKEVELSSEARFRPPNDSSKQVNQYQMLKFEVLILT
jgi:hypothetical protein